MIDVHALQWRQTDFAGKTFAADAFGIKGFYRISGKPGEWSLLSPGPLTYMETPGYQTQVAAKDAASVDFKRRVEACFCKPEDSTTEDQQ